MRRELAIEFSRVTESAALAGYKWLGRGDKNTADGAAVNAMRIMLNQVNIDGTHERNYFITAEFVGEDCLYHLDNEQEEMEHFLSYYRSPER